MTRFKTKEEFETFCDTSMKCLCGRLMTGLHMNSCYKVKQQRAKLSTIDEAMK